jgi:hypothetical protein
MTRDGIVSKSRSVTSDRFLASSSLSSSTPALDVDVSFKSDIACMAASFSTLPTESHIKCIAPRE